MFRKNGAAVAGGALVGRKIDARLTGAGGATRDILVVPPDRGGQNVLVRHRRPER